MATKKLSALTALTTVADDDLLLINDVSEALAVNQSKKITGSNLRTYMAGTVETTLAALETLLMQSAGGRLTLSSGVPDVLSDQANKTTVYYTPYISDVISLYDGSSAWELFTFSELSLSLSGYTASKPYDIFIYDDSGSPTLESLVWSSTTVRGTALTRQNGILVKDGATTRRYLGTIYISADGNADDSQDLRMVWNNYNRIRKMLYKRSDSASDLYFIVGNPVGQYIPFGAGATFNGDGATAMYLRSTVEPSGSAPYTSEALSQHTDSKKVGFGQTEMGLFATGLSYVGWDSGGAGSLDYGHIWGDFWC